MDRNENLATEMLREIKITSRRWFIAFVITLCLWFGTIGGFIWYISLPTEEVSTEVMQDSDNESVNNFVGGDYVGSEANGS